MLKAPVNDLHHMDFGAHLMMWEEWNEVEVTWHESTVLHAVPVTTVITPGVTDGFEFLCVATYDGLGEGDLITFDCIDRHGVHVLYRPAGSIQRPRTYIVPESR